MAINYGTDYPSYQYPRQPYPPTQPGTGYQPMSGYHQLTNAELDEYKRQPAYAPVATAPVIPILVHQQPLYSSALGQYQQQQSSATTTIESRPNVVVIHNSSSPSCFCMCLRAICNVIWTILLFIIIAILVVLGIFILHKYVN